MRIGNLPAQPRRDSLLGSLVAAALVISGPAFADPAKTTKPAATLAVSTQRPATASGVLPIMGMAAQPTLANIETLEAHQRLTQQTRELDRALFDCRSGKKPWTPALKSFAALIDDVADQPSAESAALLASTWTNVYMRGDKDTAHGSGLLAALESGQANEQTRAALSYYVLAKRGVSVGLVDFQVYENSVRIPGQTRTLTVVRGQDKTLILDPHILPNKPATLSYDTFRQYLAAVSFIANDVGVTGLYASPYFNPDNALWPMRAVTEFGSYAYPPEPFVALGRDARAAFRSQPPRDALSIRPTDQDALSLAVVRVGLSAARARGLVIQDVPAIAALQPRDDTAPKKSEAILLVRSTTGDMFEAKTETERNFVILPRINGAFGMFPANRR